MALLVSPFQVSVSNVTAGRHSDDSPWRLDMLKPNRNKCNPTVPDVLTLAIYFCTLRARAQVGAWRLAIYSCDGNDYSCNSKPMKIVIAMLN
eukprot:1789324-Amphidinium_carterae.1